MSPDLEAARGRTIPDVIAAGLDVLFCGINPSLWSGATGWHFAHPGNRFWPALHRSGFTPRRLHPSEQRELLDHGLGITNLVARSTGKASELEADELRRGGRRLHGVVASYRPTWVAVVGITAYRTAIGVAHARVGRQEETVGEARLWVLPNPSGLNAHYTPAGLAREFECLRAAVRTDRQPGRRRGITT